LECLYQKNIKNLTSSHQAISLFLAAMSAIPVVVIRATMPFTDEAHRALARIARTNR